MKDENQDELPKSEEPSESVNASNLLDELRNESNAYKEQLFRARAELENQRKRLEREMDNARKYAIQDFVVNLLPAKDSMEKGMDVVYMENGISAEALMEGSISTLKICNEAFKQSGVEEIDPLGEEFNPEFHEAMAMKKVEGKEPNIVLSVFQKGYLLNGRLIRPARVEVSGA